MKNKKLLYIVLGILTIVQLAIPLKMISKNNDILKNGKILKFKCIPFDPYDAFRGKYIHLNFNLNSVFLNKKINSSKEVYALLETDKDGFAKIKNISTTAPSNSTSYVKVKISSQYEYNSKIQIWIDFPFQRYYMNENKAPLAEKIYNKTISNSTKKAYALIAIKEGEGVVKDVMIDSLSIKDYIKRKPY